MTQFTPGSSRGSSKHPEFKIVNSVEGDWDQTTAQKAVATVLPSLPEIVGVVDQGGDGYGAAQAFAGAGRKQPIIIMGNRQDELAWWKEQKAKNGYTTWSASIAPWCFDAGVLGGPADSGWPQGYPARLAGAVSGLYSGRF